MREIGRGAKVFDAPAVQGPLRRLAGPDDVLALLDEGAEGAVALVEDAGATFLTPLYEDLAAVLCRGGTPRSHIGIVSREYQLPCLMGVVFVDGEPPDGRTVEVDCTAAEGIVRG